MNSKRRYKVTYIEGNNFQNHSDIDLDFLNSKTCDWEYVYAIQDNIDAVLDLKLGESIAMNFNRDNKDAFGVIKRVK